MSYPTPNEIDDLEQSDYFYRPTHACANCGVTAENGAYLSDHVTEEGPTILLCAECAVEESRVVRQASGLAAAPSSCAIRAAIVDRAQSSRQLVNALRAHELTECAACGSTRKTVASDRLYVAPGAVCCEGEVA